MSNLKVILLDDEMLIRKLIRMKMNAEELGLEIVGEFSNAKSALKELVTLKPDIIISDICMPEMDGLSFGEECTKLLPGVKIIIVTGYNDFEYARRSLQVGVFDYLMKPVQSVELNQTLEKAIAQIRLEQEQENEQKKLKDTIEKGIPVLRRSYINQLLLSDFPVYNMENMLNQYGIKVNTDSNSRLCVGIIAIQESFMAPEIVEAINEEAETFFYGDDYVNVVLDVWGRIVIISDEAECSFAECFSLLLQNLEKKYAYHMNTGLSQFFAGWSEVRAAYLSALDDMQRNHESGGYEKITDAIAGEMMRWKRPINHMKENQLEDAVREVEVIIYVDIAEDTSTRQLKDMVSSRLAEMCAEAKLPAKATEYQHMIECCRLRIDVERCVRFIVMDMTLILGEVHNTEKGKLILDIIDYMKQNLHQPTLGMGDLVNEFCCSSSHLSRLFKQYMGRTYGEYLSELRLWKMLLILASDREMLDRDIGEQIGITDAHYLSIWFKKMTGYSVTEYRKVTL